MLRVLKAAGAAVLAGALACGIAPAQGKPIRHLVYKFDVTFTTDETVHDSGIGGGPASGMAENYAGQSDEGQIIVDVVQVQPDTGLVVQISEYGRNRRNAVQTECVVYGSAANGNVVCDQSKGEVNEEEMSLLRLLGRSFIDRSLIDLHQHWETSQSSPDVTETNDYTIAKEDAGIMSIDFVRVLKVSGAQRFDATSHGSLVYDSKLSVPTSVKEETVTRKHIDQTRDDRISQQITLTLTTDSMRSAAQK
jgi:hypothetical protein